MREIYLVQSKRTKSLGVIIPAKITKEYESTDFTRKVERQAKTLTVNATGTKVEKFKNITMPAVESFEASTQQVSSS